MVETQQQQSLEEHRIFLSHCQQHIETEHLCTELKIFNSVWNTRITIGHSSIYSTSKNVAYSIFCTRKILGYSVFGILYPETFKIHS